MKKVVLALVLLMLLMGSVYAFSGEKSWVTLVLERLFFLTPQVHELQLDQTIIPVSYTPPVSVQQKSACGLKEAVIVEETADAVLLKNGTLQVNPIDGKVTVRNRSTKDRLWDVLVLLGKTETTDIRNPYMTIGEILPGKTEETSYTSTELNFPITYSEDIDTYSTDAELQKYFVYGTNQPVLIDISIDSNSDKALDIDYSRTIAALNNVKVRGADYNAETSTISWKGRLHQGQKVNIKIEGGLTASSIDNITLGTAQITITGDDKLLTGAEIESVSAHAPNEWFHKEYQDERDRNLWHIEMRFRDLSDFQTSINKIKVYDAVTEDVIRESTDAYLVLNPGESWEENLTYRATHFPSFRYDFSYSAKLDFGTCSLSKLESEAVDFQVASMKMKKTLENAALDVAKTNQPVLVELELTNDGTAPISELFIEDRVCSGFEASDIKAYLIDNLGKKDITSSIEFTSQNSRINFIISDFAESIGTQLGPLDKVVLDYKLKPINPAPGECRTEATGYANTMPRGPQIKLSSVSPISVTEGLQGFSVERVQVSQDSVRVKVENVGNSQTPHVQLRSLLSEGFAIKSSSNDYLVDGRYIVWDLGEMAVGKTVSIYYTIDGKGDYLGTAEEPFLVAANEEGK